MSRESRALLIGASIAFGVGLLSAAGAQELKRKEAQPQQPQQQKQQPQLPQFQPSQQQDLQEIWQMQQAQMKARIAGAMQQLSTACQDELRNFCSTVTPGEGRLLLCMQAHEDKIGRQCELAMLETSRNIGKAVRRMENFAQACWQDIQVHCSGSNKPITQCVIENRASLSPPCQATLAATLPAARQSQGPQQGRPSLMGLAIYSADGMMLGQVTGMKRRPDGSVEAIEAEIGSPLGLGASSVLISPDDLRWRGDGVELQMVAEQVRNILQGQKR